LPNDKGSHVFRDVTGGIGLDEEVEVAGLVVPRDGSIGTNNLFVGTVGLGEGRRNGDMLADGEPKDGISRGKLESVALRVSIGIRFCWGGFTDMATLWEMIVFSVSSKFWKASGLSTFFSPRVSVSFQPSDRMLAREVEANPYSCCRISILPTPVREQWHREAILFSRSGSPEPADQKECIRHRHMISKNMDWKPPARRTS
jgi:hypothetical protein